MAASPADFQWFHDADDDFPIGQTNESTPDSSAPSRPPSAGPSNRVRQLRGQSKVLLTPPTTDVVTISTDTTRSRRRRRSDASEQQGPRRSKRAVVTQPKGKQRAVISLDSEPEKESTSGSSDGDLSGDDDAMLSGQDKSVSLCCSIWIPTDEIYYRNASAAIVCVAKTSAVPTSTFCLRRGNAIEMVKR